MQNSLLQSWGETNLTKSEIMFGCITLEKNSIINHIILEAKYYIYVCKLEKCIPLFNRLKYCLRISENIEKRIAIKAKKS